MVLNWTACAKERYEQGFQVFTTKSTQLLLKTSPKNKYRISGVASTHEVEKQPTATVEKVAEFHGETVDLAALAQRAAIRK